MTCVGLLLFAAAYASFTIVPERSQVHKARSIEQSDLMFRNSILNTRDISSSRPPLNGISQATSDMNVTSRVAHETSRLIISSTPKSNSSPTSFGLDLTFVSSCVAYASVNWAGMCARGIIDSIVFAVALAAQVSGRRLYGWANAVGALSAMVSSILYGSVLDLKQNKNTPDRWKSPSANGSELFNENWMAPQKNNSGMEKFMKAYSASTSDYAFRFSFVIACGCVALLLNILSVSFYRTAPRNRQKSVLKDVWNAIRNTHVASIFFVIFMTGFLTHSYDVLYFWYIQDLGGSTFFVGLILALRRVAEIAGNLLGPVVFARIGPKRSFLLVFTAHVLRFATLAMLPYTAHIHISLGPIGPARPAYWMLPVETLHAITFSFDRLVYSSELSAHSPASSISSLVAIGQSVQLGLGAGLIGLCQGVAYSTIGPQAFYAFLTAVALTSGVLYAFSQYCLLTSSSTACNTKSETKPNLYH